MFNVERLLEPMVTQAMISGVYNCSLWEKLYTILDKNLLSIKHVMEHNIMVEKASMIKQGHLHFHSQEEFLPLYQSLMRASKKKNKEEHPWLSDISWAHDHTFLNDTC